MVTPIQAPFTSPWPEAWAPLENPTLKDSIYSVAKKIFSVIAFPYTIFQALRARLAGFIWKHLVVPGKLSLSFNGGQWLLRKYEGVRPNIVTADSQALDSAFFEGKAHPDKAILFIGGNGSHWQFEGNFVDMFYPLDTHLLMVSPRNRHRSDPLPLTACNEKGYLLDVYAAVQYLICEKGIDPKDIAFVGFSMGGALTTKGAALIQEEYSEEEIGALNLCSFSSLGEEIEQILGGSIIGKIARFGAYLLGLNLDVAPDWDQLKGPKGIMYRPDDEIIKDKASLYQKVTTADGNIQKIDANRNHNGWISNKERQLIQDKIQKMLDLPLSEEISA